MMKKYITKRLVHMFITFLGAIFFMLFIYLSLPANYVSTLILDMPLKERIALEHKYHLDEPKIKQFGRWAVGLLKGDLGYSFANERPVFELAKPAFIKSFSLFLISMFIAILIAIPISINCAKNQNNYKDLIWSLVAFAGISLPPFVLGAILSKVFTFNLTVFRLDIFKVISFKEYSNMMNHYILPFVVLTFSNIAIFLRYLRSSIIEIQRSEFINTAKAKGLSDRVVYYKHVLGNGLIPVLTVLGGNIPSMVSSLLMIEIVFGYDGLASLMMNSVHNRDYPLSMAFTMILAMTILLANFIIDILYAVVDPRIKLEK
jgi:peptide/nickel transport system permease protein